MVTTVSLGEFVGDSIVVHFGGEQSINAYTFAQSLMGFADTARAVSASIDPGQDIEIYLEQTGPGSFRAVVRRIRRDYGGVFSGPVGIVFWGIVTNIIYDKVIKPPDAPPQIIVNTQEVVIKYGGHAVVVPRVVYDAAENAKKSQDVKQGLRRTFDPLEKDPKVVEFGLTTGLADAVPIVIIPRQVFPRYIEGVAILEETQTERVKEQTARLVILKAWLNHSKRKWSFDWNGVLLSAPIAHTAFLDNLGKRQPLIGAGDALDVELTFKQVYDKAIKTWVTDPKSFVISKVVRHIPSI